MSDMALQRTSTDLRLLTAARVSLQMTGHSLVTSEVLAFQLAHAQARDAVHVAFDREKFAEKLRTEIAELCETHVDVLTLQSSAADRANYLRYPHKGRTLTADSAALLRKTPCDLAITIADGLATQAVERNAIPLLISLLPRLTVDGWLLAPVTVVQQGRVAICDEIGEGFGARCSLILIGERPGLSAIDSMGAYLTWGPHIGRTDAERNCVSNIRNGGLSTEEAAERLMSLMSDARTKQMTGVDLKLRTNFLLNP